MSGRLRKPAIKKTAIFSVDRSPRQMALISHQDHQQRQQNADIRVCAPQIAYSCGMKKRQLLIILTAISLFGCSGREILESIDGTVPQGIDLSGNWRIRADMAAEQKRLRDAIRRTDGFSDKDLGITLPKSSSRPSASSKPQRSKGGLVHVFLETGASLKVTQTPHALYVSFDRSVVEEYRFGENRVISVGEIQAQRVTGWIDDTLTVKTIDRNNMKLTERFRLIDGGKTLQRVIVLRGKNEDEQTVVQEFDRAD